MTDESDCKRAEARESFVCWQRVTREQFSSVSNLVLGLATGLLAFFAKDLQEMRGAPVCLHVLGVLSLVFLAASIAVAVGCAYNRLNDFRKTAQIARKRSQGESVPSADRDETKVLGEITWCLFRWQLGLFGAGMALAMVMFIMNIWAVR